MNIELQTDRLRKETAACDIHSKVHFHSRTKQWRLTTLEATDANNHHRPQAVAFTLLHVPAWDATITAVDKLLENHKLMGETFSRKGYKVRQNRLFRARLPLLNPRLAKLYRCSVFQSAEVECYEFWANSTLYGIVIEIKHPHRRQAPERPAIGLHSILQQCGVGRQKIMQALDGGVLPGPTRLLAQGGGLIKSWRMYWLSRRAIKMHLPFH